MEDELGVQIINEFVGIKAKTYSYLKDNNYEDKKANGTKKCSTKKCGIKNPLNFKIIKTV